MNKLDELEKLATELRDTWSYFDGETLRKYHEAAHPGTILKLIAVARAAREFQQVTHWGMAEFELELSDKLNKALAALVED